MAGLTASDANVLAAAMLAMLAAAMLYARYLRRERAQLRRSLTQQCVMQGQIEQLGQIGSWWRDFTNNRSNWSDEMCRMHGFAPGRTPTPEQWQGLLADGGAYLTQMLDQQACAQGRYRIEYEITRPDGEARLFRMDAQNEFDRAGARCGVNAIIHDVTEEYRRTERLNEERSAALMMAAEAREMALTDPLTGLANRRKVMAEVDRAILRCREKARELSLIVFDLDHFKRVNDTFGHQTGDRVLQRIARIALAQIRDSDIVGRVGGEEFVWLLPDAGPALAKNAAERLRRAIESSSGMQGLPPITASIGHASYGGGDTGLTLFAAADAALYAAKQAGRNQVRMAA